MAARRDRGCVAAACAARVRDARRSSRTPTAASSCRSASLQTRSMQLKRLGKPFLELGRQGRAAVVRRADAAALRPRAALDTEAILETLVGHKRDKQGDLLELFGDPQRSIADQVLQAYEHQDSWVNRLILGDSLVVMNSLLEYEGLGGQVQMIYIDPPYGVKFGTNFQPFVREARRQAQRRRGHDARAGDGEGVPRHVGARACTRT